MEGLMNSGEKPADPNTNDAAELSEEQQAYIKKMLKRLMELGIGAVYGDEDDSENAVAFSHGERLSVCRAVCCSFIFALTKEEVQKGLIRWDSQRPYFVHIDKDGYCHHLNRETFICTIWDERPQRCRKYDCRKDPNVWLDWDHRVINPRVFDHLRKKK
jgi:hypothetical protein